MLIRTYWVLLSMLSAGQLPAQISVLEGTVTASEDSSAIAYALLRLEAQEGNTWIMRQQGITRENGRFRFAAISPGTYRVQLLRIGFKPQLSEVARVTGGSITRLDMRAPAQSVVLATVSVYANATCLSARQLSSNEKLAELWRQVRTGVETRRAFEQQYSFQRTLKQDVILERRIGGRKRQSNVAVVVYDPDSVSARDARRQARNRTLGYGSLTTITLPDEKEIFDDSFLATHCVETDVAEENGAFGLRFRPLSIRRDIAEVRGQVWVDAKTYQVRRLEVEYQRGDKPFAEAAVDYADVVIGGKPLRLPSTGTAILQPSGAAAVVVKRATSKFNYAYDRVEVKAR